MSKGKKKASKRQPVVQEEAQPAGPIDMDVGVVDGGLVALRVSRPVPVVNMAPQQAVDLAKALAHGAQKALERQKQLHAKAAKMLGGQEEVDKLLAKRRT